MILISEMPFWGIIDLSNKWINKWQHKKRNLLEVTVLPFIWTNITKQKGKVDIICVNGAWPSASSRFRTVVLKLTLRLCSLELGLKTKVRLKNENWSW